MPKYFDIHSHLNFPEYDADRAETINRMKEKDVWTITVGTDLESSRRAVALASENINLFACIGLHPLDETKNAPPVSFEENQFEKLIVSPKVVAIGECGLDYGRSGTFETAEKIRQKQNFERQIDFAVLHHKPLMLHVRNAQKDVLDILASKKKRYGDLLRGNVHFFSGNTEIEKKYLELDFSISFTGVITFTSDYDEAVRYAPLEMIMSETDAPFVAPVPYRGKRNEPAYVVEVIKKMAQIKAKSEEVMRKNLVENALRVFNISS